MHALLLHACFSESVIGAAPYGRSSELHKELAVGLLAGGRGGPCSDSYLDVNGFSKKAMDQWLHQGEGDNFSTADLG